jgi:hypothetical protein
MAVSGVARLQGGRPVAVFYSFGHPTTRAYDILPTKSTEKKTSLESNFESLISVLIQDLEKLRSDGMRMVVTGSLVVGVY